MQQERISKMKSQKSTIPLLKTVLSIGAALGIWQVVSILLSPIYFASPIEVAAELKKMFLEKSIFLDILHSIRRITVALLLSIIAGVPVGLMIGYHKKMYESVSSILDFIRSIPPIVFYPLLLIILGPYDSSRVGTALLGALVVIVLIVAKGLHQEDVDRRLFAKSMNAKNKVYIDVIVFEALPHIMTAIKTAASLTIIIIIVTEMIVGGTHGLGVRIQNVQITNNIPDLYATILIIGILGVFINKVLITIDKKVVFWKSRQS